MFGKIGLPELVLILAIALIIFGPRKLPEIGKSIGKGLREFRQATSEAKKSVSLDESYEEELEEKNPENKKKESPIEEIGEDGGETTTDDAFAENEQGEDVLKEEDEKNL